MVGGGLWKTSPPDLLCKPCQLGPEASKNCIRALGDRRKVISGRRNGMNIGMEVGNSRQTWDSGARRGEGVGNWVSALGDFIAPWGASGPTGHQ